MQVYDAIFKRRSVREFDKTPLDSEVLTDIQGYLDAIEPIAGQSARFCIVGADAVKNDSAPHYILAYCEASDSAYANVGYILQNIDLYIQNMGLGSLWLGVAKPYSPEEDYCIMMAFGRTEIPARSRAQDFTRLPITEISNVDNAVAQAARIAPSAMNSQPWKVHFADGKVTITYFGRGVTQLILKKKLSKIDLGIITRHVVIALQHEGKIIQSVVSNTQGKEFSLEILYQ